MNGSARRRRAAFFLRLFPRFGGICIARLAPLVERAAACRTATPSGPTTARQRIGGVVPAD